MMLSMIAMSCFTANAQSTDYLKAFTQGDYKPLKPAEVYHMNDGEHYTTLSSDGKRIIAFEYGSGKATDTILNLDKVPDCKLKAIVGYEFSSNEQKILVHTEVTKIYRRSFTTTYYVYNVKRNRIEPLTTTTNDQQMAQFSPDGRIVAFARHQNLFLKKLDFNTEIAITEDGEKNKIINGTPDWVYEEEFGATRYFEWSPDSKLLAYVRFDETAVKEFSFQQFNDDYPTLYTYKYPRPGKAYSLTTLQVYDVQNRTTKKMQLGNDTDTYLTQIRWSNDENGLTIVKLNRNQTTLNLLQVNPRSGVATRLLSETSKTYVDYENLKTLTFNKDNSFVCMSERDGYRHLYLFNANGTLARQLTKGNWDVTDFYGYDELTKTAYFQAAKESPLERHVYKVDSKGKIVCLDARAGTHQASFAKSFKVAIAQFNNTTTPNCYSVITNAGKNLRIIEDNKLLADKVAALHLPTKEFFQFKTSENITLNGWLVKPKNMEAGKEYPLVMVQYSGPNSQEVLNKWNLDWEYYLAQEGYVVACVDGRGTGARGRDFRNCTYWHLGVLETKDQVEAAHYLGKQNYIDANRIAIWGWSYGGFMTLNCLTYGNGTFKAGIAVAPVTDWNLYNTAYTERFMSRPQENYQGYEQVNLLDKANQLQGNLLLVHGTADDNVHAQQTLLYTEKLVEAGKQFEMQLYTNKNHSILGAQTRLHLYTRFNEFLKKNL